MSGLLTYIFAGLFCGLVCLLSQIIINNTKLTSGHVTSMFVVIGAVLEFFNIYGKIREVTSMGASMVICSFGSVIMEGVKEGVNAYGILGIFSGVFSKCGIILSFAIFLAFISTIFFKPRS